MTFNAAFWLSLVLALAGCSGLVLAGRGKWYGWAIGLAVQPVWVAFGIITKGYGLCLTALLYGTVYTRNLRAWRQRPEPTQAVCGDVHVFPRDTFAGAPRAEVACGKSAGHAPVSNHEGIKGDVAYVWAAQ